MHLQEVFDYLAHGELSQLSIGSRNVGSIAESDYAKIVSHINLALLNLYTFFPIKESEVLVMQQEGITMYTLDSKHAQSNSDSTAVKYIEDAHTLPFMDDVLKIEEVYRAGNKLLPLNNLHDCESAFTPAYNVVQLPRIEPGELVSVVYQARHPKINVGPDNDISNIIIELPSILLEPLLVYVHSRIAANSGSEGSLNESRLLKSEYEKLIQTMRNREIFNRDASTNLKLRVNGWV